MHCERAALLIISWLLLALAPVQAQTQLKTLTNNPFSRPEIVKPKPPPVVVQSAAEVEADAVDLELNAVMVSTVRPMVIVNDQMIAIGEKIGEMTLIAVVEGGAIFTMAGKKYSFTVAKPEQDPANTQ